MSAFPKYDRYKDSGVEWLGEIPEHWEANRVFSAFNERVERGNDELPILNISIKNGVLEDRPEGDREQRTIEDRTAYKRAAAGDIAYNTMRMWQGAVGDVPVDGLISPAYVVARPIKAINTRYYSYLFRGEQFQVETNRHSYGIVSDRNRLYWLGFKNIVIPIPPKPEQDRIVTFLDRKTAEIDALIAKKQRQIELLDEQKAILINRAVTRGLNPNAKLKPSGIEWIGEIPEGWEVLKLKRVIPAMASGTSVNAKESGENSKGYRILKTSCVYTRVFRPDEFKPVKESENRLVKCPVKGNEIIISRMNTPELVGAAAHTPHDYPNLFLPDRLWQTEIDHKKADARYITLFINSSVFRPILAGIAVGSSSSMQNISRGDFLNLPAPIPPVEIQTAIADHIATVSYQFIGLGEEITLLIHRLKTLRNTLIAHAVTGKIKV